MSRTNKDKPRKFSNLKENELKPRNYLDPDHNWYSATPSWWTRLMMNRPQRAEAHKWEQNAKHTPIDQLEELDTPSVSRKPHVYFW